MRFYWDCLFVLILASPLFSGGICHYDNGNFMLRKFPFECKW